MINYNRYAPIIKARYLDFEARMAESQAEMEAEFLRLCGGKKRAPKAALKLLRDWSDDWLSRALRVASDLEERLFTELTKDIEAEYMFHGA
jgi:hypothetical protein